MAKIIDEFKAFALKGNVVDMAVGVIIGEENLVCWMVQCALSHHEQV